MMMMNDDEPDDLVVPLEQGEHEDAVIPIEDESPIKEFAEIVVADDDHRHDQHHYEASVEEPASKKLKTGDSPNKKNFTSNRNRYKGIRIRRCLCGKPECLPRVKGWIDLGCDIRAGYKELPRQSTKQTPTGLEKNRIRDIMFLHTKGSRAPRYQEGDKTNRERKLFVAYHHFHPLLLMSNNKGPITYVDMELAERIGTFHERDTVESLPGVIFHAIPSYPKELEDRDFFAAGGIEQQRATISIRNVPPTVQERVNATKSNKARVREALVTMEKDPLLLANTYIGMLDRIAELEEELAAANATAAAVAVAPDDAEVAETTDQVIAEILER